MSLMFQDGSRTRSFSPPQGGQQPQAPSWQNQNGSFNYGGWLNSQERADGDPQAQQAWQQAGSPRSFRPGQAQPIQLQSQGTPYGQQQPFTQAMQTPFGQMDPNQYYQQRDAFIQTANDQMGQYMANGGVYQGQGAPPPTWGQPPQFNPMQMWGQAGGMVQQGWQNPYTQPSGQPYGGGYMGQPPAPAQAPPQQKPPPDLLQQYQSLVMRPTSKGANYGRGYEAAFNEIMPEAQASGLYTDQQLQALRDEHVKYMAHERKTGPGRQQAIDDHNKMMANMDASSLSQKRAIDAANPKLKGKGSAPDALARVSAANRAATGPATPVSPPGVNPFNPSSPEGLAWSRDNQRAGVASQANKQWLASLTPANRRIYSMMQNMY